MQKWERAVGDKPTERFENGRRIFKFMPSTIEEMMTACTAPVPNKEIIPTEAFMRDVCERLLALEEARRG